MESSCVALVSLLVTLNIAKRIYAFFSSFNPAHKYIFKGDYNRLMS